MESYRIMNDGCVQRQSDLALIPPTYENPDYVQYLDDQDNGSEVLPFDYEAEEARQLVAKESADREYAIQAEMQRILREQAVASLATRRKT